MLITKGDAIGTRAKVFKDGVQLGCVTQIDLHTLRFQRLTPESIDRQLHDPNFREADQVVYEDVADEVRISPPR